MKILITESQTVNLIEGILESEGITYNMRYQGEPMVGLGLRKLMIMLFLGFIFQMGMSMNERFLLSQKKMEYLDFLDVPFFQMQLMNLYIFLMI